ncbi:hypothetical protein BTW10_10520 [Chromohalobacter japonicus]|uniref:DNA-binding protein n=1 Tax=Chromohalobacter japonicus TaxID=223900 RepID=A0A1Q8TC24_9GAMM|nr:hypothetical protein BTW10_10520 [Chromohalobacter japonicus]
MACTAPDYEQVLASALERYRAGLDPELIELPERAVFPYLIPAQPATARKSRVTGMLLGIPAPCYVKRGRSVRYRLADVLNWMSNSESITSTAAGRS